MGGLQLRVRPPLPPSVYLRRPARSLPFPLEDPRCRLFALARHGLWHAVRSLGLSAGEEVLTPAYHHGSEVDALVRAGLRCRFYEARDDLQPDEAELEELRGPAVRALVLTHYLGFPQDAARWRRWCDERGLLLIEDAAQAWLASRDGLPVGALGDAAVFCLYKTFGLSEGAALVCEPPPDAPRPARLGAVDLARRHGSWLAQHSSLAAAAFGRLVPPVPYSVERDLGLGDPDSPPWRHVGFVLPRVADAAAAARRRANYAVLLGALGEAVPSPFDELANGASPFALPVEVEDKRGLLDRLARQGIKGLDLWSVPHPSLQAERFPAAARRRATAVGLPVHQELRSEDLERIAEATAAWAIPTPSGRR